MIPRWDCFIICKVLKNKGKGEDMGGGREERKNLTKKSK